MSKKRTNFDEWITELDEEIIQEEYGYERGEFTVYPEHWRSMFEDGLTPSQAFVRALNAFSDARKENSARQQTHWEEIKRFDAQAIARDDAP